MIFFGIGQCAGAPTNMALASLFVDLQNLGDIEKSSKFLSNY